MHSLFVPAVAIAAAAAVSGAAAFLIPPSASFDALPVEIGIDDTSRSFQLPCPDCPLPLFFASAASSDQSDSGLKSAWKSLHLDFAVDRAASALDHDRLLLNNLEIFPDLVWPAPLYSLQALPFPNEQVRPVLRSLGYVLTASTIVDPEDDLASQLQLLKISLRILDVDAVPVSGVPTAVLMVIRNPDGRLMIANVEINSEEVMAIDSPAPPTIPEPEPVQCLSIKCRIHAWLATIKPAAHHSCHSDHKNRPTSTESLKIPQVQPESDDVQLPTGEEKHAGHHHRKHHHNSHHNSHHRQHRPMSGLFFKTIYTQVVLPVLIGLGAGVTLSMLGMVIVTACIAFWALLGRWCIAITGRGITPDSSCFWNVFDYRYKKVSIVDNEAPASLTAFTDEKDSEHAL